MTVKELIETLSDFDPNMEVKFAYNYGDYWCTEVAGDITDVDTGETKYSDYHRMDKVIKNNDDDEDSDYEEVVILR